MLTRVIASTLMTCFALLVSMPSYGQTTSSMEGSVRDPQGLAVPGINVTATSRASGATWTSVSDSNGRYHIAGLPAGTYVVSTSPTSSFATTTYPDIEVLLNRTLPLDIQVNVGGVRAELEVRGVAPDLKTDTPELGGNITPATINNTPLNGRNYVDLLQLVPGVTVNRQANQGSDQATPILGERAGNTAFLIDGMSNENEFAGGASAQFNQDTIQEFQVLTTGYKAEFGHGSGGVVNVITKSGTNTWHGSAFVFHRNSVLDRSNSLDPTVTQPPLLLRWDYGVTVGGPLKKGRVFFFGSAERIRERRELNFVFVPGTPDVVANAENSFNDPNRTYDTRLFGKLDQQLGKHHITEEVNQTVTHITNFLPLSEAGSLPSTRRDEALRTTSVGVHDTVLFGNQSNPFLLDLHFNYRDIPSTDTPAHPEAGPQTLFFIFSQPLPSARGDIGSVSFGSARTPGSIHEKYPSFGGTLSKLIGRHNIKIGTDFLHTHVDGVEENIVFNQLFATPQNFATYGPIFSGLFSVRTIGGATPADNNIRLRNNYVGLFGQDDWRILPSLTVNLGLRWDYDSEFETTRNVSPRVGFAWAPTRKTVVRGSFGFFYDHFRLGLARDIPAFGGANLSLVQPLSYPQLFYNTTTTLIPSFFGICIAPDMTQAQINASGQTCPLGPYPYRGADFLNNIVATGHAPIPPNTVVTESAIQQLSGLSPDQFLAAVNSAVALPPGFSWFWGPFGTLSHTAGPLQQFPVTLDPRFRTPFTRSWTIGVQRQITSSVVGSIDYVHKAIRDVPAIRETNLAFISRLPGHQRTFDPPFTAGAVNAYGPWLWGDFDAVILHVRKQFSHRFTLQGSYTYTNAFDNILSATLGGGEDVFGNYPADSFIGVPPVVTETTSGKTNANGPFIAANGNPVPQAGIFYYGPRLDWGRSNLALRHTLVLDGTVQLPWKFQVSGVLRAQSGFPYSRATATPVDVDGDLFFTDRDYVFARNTFDAPSFVNVDTRFSKVFRIGERTRITTMVEFFNLLNRQNPAAIETVPGRPTPVGSPLQVLPGMETQLGLRIEF